jgi:hypothetical protein
MRRKAAGLAEPTQPALRRTPSKSGVVSPYCGLEQDGQGGARGSPLLPTGRYSPAPGHKSLEQPCYPLSSPGHHSILNATRGPYPLRSMRSQFDFFRCSASRSGGRPSNRGDDESLHAGLKGRVDHRCKPRAVSDRQFIDVACGVGPWHIGRGPCRRRTRTPTGHAIPCRTNQSPRPPEPGRSERPDRRESNGAVADDASYLAEPPRCERVIMPSMGTYNLGT